MKKFNLIVKKNVVISVLVILALVLGIGLISYVNRENKARDSKILLDGNKMKDVNLDKIKTDDENKVPEINTNDNAEKTALDSKENANTETVNKETVPTKPEPPKEKPKTNDDITDKNKVPTYSEKEVGPQVNTTPKGGEINNKGQTYLPGFDWVDNSGSNKGENVTSGGDINKQVGKMD